MGWSDGGAAMIFFYGFLVLVALVGFAIFRRKNVRASVKFKSIGFDLEASDDASSNTPKVS